MKDNKKNRRQICGLCFVSLLVRIGRLELPLREELDPKSSAATNYAISASDWFLGRPVGFEPTTYGTTIRHSTN